MIAWTSIQHLGRVASAERRADLSVSYWVWKKRSLKSHITYTTYLTYASTTSYNKLHFTKKTPKKTQVTSSIWHLVHRADSMVVPSSFEVTFEVVRCVASVDSLGICENSAWWVRMRKNNWATTSYRRLLISHFFANRWGKKGLYSHTSRNMLAKLTISQVDASWVKYHERSEGLFFWGGLLPCWELTIPSQGTLEDYLPFLMVGYVSPLEVVVRKMAGQRCRQNMAVTLETLKRAWDYILTAQVHKASLKCLLIIPTTNDEFDQKSPVCT